MEKYVKQLSEKIPNIMGKYIKHGETIYEKLEWFWYKNVDQKFIWVFRYFFVSVKNLIRWTPIIWKDRDWDHQFIILLLSFKLKNIKERLEKKEIYVGQEIEIKWIDICINLIDTQYWDNDIEAKPLNYKNIASIKRNKRIMEIKHWKCDAREEKALQLFWKIMAWRSDRWWD